MKLRADRSVLCVIDVQERLVPAMADADRVVARCLRLATAATILGVPAILTEQYPKGLGPTVPSLAATLPSPLAKMSFSCCGAASFSGYLPGAPFACVLCGLETHVCVTQTAIDLREEGHDVFVVVDAVASRHAIDHDVALRRLEAAGIILTTSESVLFEWCGTAEHPRFQEVRRLVIDS